MKTTSARLGRVAFIGGGNMAEALIGGLIRSAVCRPPDICVADVSADRTALLKERFGVDATADNAAAVKGADVVVLAVKPQILPDVVAALAGPLERRSLVLSIAAGVRTAAIEQKLGDGARVVRVMPNTPALVGAGAAAFCGGRWAEEEDLRKADAMISASGIAVRVKEAEMDAVTALSGSGPAYVFYLIEAMLEAARQMGLEAGTAKSLVHATVAGAARLIGETGVSAEELRRRVTSKGGTTAAAIAVLDQGGVAGNLVRAILAARDRSKELSGS